MIGPRGLLPEEEKQKEEMVDLQVAVYDKGLQSFKLCSNFVWTVLLAIKIFILQKYLYKHIIHSRMQEKYNNSNY